MYSHLPTIPHTVDRQGFVLVHGQRVINTIDNGRPVFLKSRTSARVTCQLCAQCNVDMPLRLVSEFEHSIDAQRFFHAPPVGAFNDYRHCAECKEA